MSKLKLEDLLIFKNLPKKNKLFDHGTIRENIILCQVTNKASNLMHTYMKISEMNTNIASIVVIHMTILDTFFFNVQNMPYIENNVSYTIHNFITPTCLKNL